MIKSYQEQVAFAAERILPKAQNFATIAAIYADGVSLKFDNAENESIKHYRVNTLAVFKTGNRVKITKISGTYVVEYVVGAPSTVDNADRVNNHTVKTDVPTDAVFTDTIPLAITTTLTVAGWVTNSQILTVPGVTALNTVWVAPAPASQDAYVAAGIKCTAQSTRTLTFTCVTVPGAEIIVNVILAGNTR